MACIKNLIISETSTTETDVVLIPNREITPGNLSDFRLIIACNINTPTANRAVSIQTTIGNVPLLCKYGNSVLANQLNKRIPYLILYGNENSNYEFGQFVLQNTNLLNNRGVETIVDVSI